MMFQSYALFPHLTVRDNVAFSLRVRGMSRDGIVTVTESGGRPDPGQG
jgi:ABC-type Fe3+/spermidine/putrescine transport system ATPase subunit